MQLTDSELFRQQAYFDGRWQDADSGQTRTVRNPYDDAPLGTVPDLGVDEARRAILGAQQTQTAWRQRSATERADGLMAWHGQMQRHREDLARLMTLEQGKPLTESLAEIDYAASFLRWFAEQGRRAGSHSAASHDADHRIQVIRQPVGVCAAITPWNFPAAMITRKAAPALAAGCTMLVRPASQTPFSALALAELAQRAGLPGGVFSVLTGAADTLGRELCENRTIRKLSFTGSTTVGRQLMQQCAADIKKLSLELGGNAPLLVFNDARLRTAVRGTMDSKFRNTGQTCICANRILVQDGIHEAYVKELVTAVNALRPGNGLVDGTDQGPLIDDAAIEKVEAHIDDAVRRGARVLCGGHRLEGRLFAPTVLVDVPVDARLAQEETFGPVAPVFRFDTEAEALAMANDTEFGLAAYLFSQDIDRITRASEALEAGMVGINTGRISAAQAPFGGVKQSGLGREGGAEGIEEYLEPKYLCLGITTDPDD